MDGLEVETALTPGPSPFGNLCVTLYRRPLRNFVSETFA